MATVQEIIGMYVRLSQSEIINRLKSHPEDLKIFKNRFSILLKEKQAIVEIAKIFAENGYDLNKILTEPSHIEPHNMLESYLWHGGHDLDIVVALMQYIKPRINGDHCDLFYYFNALTQIHNLSHEFDMNLAKKLASRYPLNMVKIILKSFEKNYLVRRNIELLWVDLKRDKHESYTDSIARFIRAPRRHISRELQSERKHDCLSDEYLKLRQSLTNQSDGRLAKIRNRDRNELIITIKVLLRRKPEIVLKQYLSDIMDFQAEGEHFDVEKDELNNLLNIKLNRSSIDELCRDIDDLGWQYTPVDRNLKRDLLKI